jgi:hypothetical protein
MGVSFRRAATQSSSQLVERPLSPIQELRTGREGSLYSRVITQIDQEGMDAFSFDPESA